ncbi:MAG: Fic family protein [Candidatus Peribacteria bacterium]|jgi:Fic family protein|nr:Fic family protein [Candidatus Peribacteria bacterium]
MTYQILKPNLTNISAERKQFLDTEGLKIYFQEGLEEKYSNENYLPREKIKYHPLPSQLLSHEELFYLIDKYRRGTRSPIITENGEYFKIGKPAFLEEFLYTIDTGLAGTFFGMRFTDMERKNFLQNGIIEEAVSSSQLEGALTSSKEAKRLITQNKKPVTISEKMVINNYQAMLYVRKTLKNQPLTRASLLELQNIITKGVLDDEQKVGRRRKNSDNIVVLSAITGEVYHIPPKEEFLQQEIDKLITYANDKDGQFTHPFIKASILHFWIAYLHPFCDGNGRTARAIFYRYLCKKGYWGFDYAPVSRVINDAKTQYGDMFLYAEQDGLNLTYFFVYLAKKTKQAFKEFQDYLASQREKQKSGTKKFAKFNLNDRQIRLLNHFLSHPDSFTTITIHKKYYGISKNTAKADLEELVGLEFLTANKNGRVKQYYPTATIGSIKGQ